MRAGLTRDDDYATVGKPPCDWDDPTAREALVDALVRDAQAALAVLDGHELAGALAEAAELLGLVAGQDVEAGDELITAVAVTAGQHRRPRGHRRATGPTRHAGLTPTPKTSVSLPPTPAMAAVAVSGGSEPKDFEVYGDSAYADGATLDEQAARGHDMRTKVPPVRNANGYSKDQFTIDLAAGTVTCPAHHTVAIGKGARHRVGPLRCALRVLPAAGGLHESPSGTGDQHPPP